jgi:Flp pilus assembly protein TadD
VRGGRLAAASLCALLAACSTSGPTRPAAERDSAARPSSAPAQSADSGADRRRPDTTERGSPPRAETRDAAGDAVFRAAVERSEEPAPEAALQALGRALDSMRAGDWIQAELELEHIVSQYPGYAGPHVNLALVYKQDGRMAEARAALEQALALDPGHPAANNELGILLRNEGRFEAAERAYRQALETDPGYALAHYNLGVLLDLYLRRQSEALQHYELYQASLRDPDQTVARWIIDLRRRVGVNDESARVARKDGP